MELYHVRVVDIGEISRQRADIHIRAERKGARPQAPVDLLAGFQDGRHCLAPYVGLYAHVSRHYVHQVAALGDYGVDTDGVRFAEGFPLHVDGRKAQHGCFQGVDAFLRSSTGVGFFASEEDVLADKPIIRAADPGLLRWVVEGGEMGEHRYINVVHRSNGDHLLLAAQELDLSLALQRVTVL